MNKESIKQTAVDVLNYLNQKRNKKYRPTAGTLKLITGRLSEGYTLDDCKYVIDIKCLEWTGTAQEKYLDYQTLFRPSHFPKYLEQTPEEVTRIDLTARELEQKKAMQLIQNFHDDGGVMSEQERNRSVIGSNQDSIPRLFD